MKLTRQARQCECGAAFVGFAGRVRGTVLIGNVVCAVADPDHPCRACDRMRSAAEVALVSFLPRWQRARTIPGSDCTLPA